MILIPMIVVRIRIIIISDLVNTITGFELVKQNRFAKISERNKEKGPVPVKNFLDLRIIL